jgi:hypothetical protein
VLSIRNADLADAKAAVSEICRSVSDISAPCEAIPRRLAARMTERLSQQSCRRSRSLEISRSGGPRGNFGLQVWLSDRVSARSSPVTAVQRKRGAEVEKRSGCSDLSGTPRASGRGSSESVSRDVSHSHRVAVGHHCGESGPAKRKPASVKRDERSAGQRRTATRVPGVANRLLLER